MRDKKNLSKIKYIYRIYESSDRVLHCEQYPVIYINSKVVYFKDARKKEYLNYTCVDNVWDNFANLLTEDRSHLRNPLYIDRYFWNCETNVEEIYEDLKRQRAEWKSQDEEQKKRLRLERAKREYEDALKEYEALENLGKIEE